MKKQEGLDAQNKLLLCHKEILAVILQGDGRGIFQKRDYGFYRGRFYHRDEGRSRAVL